jgi:G3E family GTPase
MAQPLTNSVPVDLVTGFLGSGKTTLINAVLRDPAFAGTLVVVNEFGEVGLDHLLVSSAADQVVLLSSGCLCCAASGSLRDTLIDLFARRSSGRIEAFSRIIVETSGLANPGPLVATLIGDSALAGRCHLTQVLTLVDAVNGAATLEQYDEARLQVAFADRLLLTKAELAGHEAVATLEARLAQLNAHAPLGRRALGEPPMSHFADADTVRTRPAFALGQARPTAWAGGAAAAHHGPAFARIHTHVLNLPQPLSWDSYAGLTQALRMRLGRRLLRCKGLLSIDDGSGLPSVVQGVQGYFAPPQRLPAWPPGVPQGFLVCIAEAVTPDEIQALVQPLIPTAESLCP